jgi:hypothetical protein
MDSRLGVLSLAIAYLLLVLGGTWHLSREDHARCAEHGEWIDVAHQSAAEHAAPRPGPVANAAGAPQEHDHCVIVEASRLRVVVCDGASAELAHGAPASISPALVDDPIVAGFDRYLLAPKQSPPC